MVFGSAIYFIGEMGKPKFRSVRRTKCPRTYMGTKSSLSSTRRVSPVNKTSTSKQKLCLSPSATQQTTPETIVSSSSVSVSGARTSCFRLVSCSQLETALQKVGQCSKCQSALVIVDDVAVRRGFVTRLTVKCSQPGCDTFAHITNPYNAEDLKVNTMSVLAARMIGRGRSGLETFSAFVNLPPPLSWPSYSTQSERIAELSSQEAWKSRKTTAQYLHTVHKHNQDEIIDVIVTCDGTWSKRGFTALYGVVVVISWETGQVLDCEVFSKFCPECRAHSHLDRQSQQFQEWMDSHNEDCAVNYSGSSPAMEAEGALRIWKRFIDTLKLRYTTVISDGDSKTIKHLNDNKPYGDTVIEKHECVGHVQKRMGTQLRNLKKSQMKDKIGKPVRFGGKGRLTDKVINQLQVFYGGAIRNNSHNIEGMEQAIWAIFYHSVSTDEHPQHDFCPIGPDSRCKFQRAIARDEKLPEHSTKIPADLAEFIKPVFIRLSDRSLLNRCLLGATQNQNESFNSIVWARCPKTEFSSVVPVQTAVNLAIITFNNGHKALEGLIQELGVTSSEFLTAYLVERDNERVQQAEIREEEVAKSRRTSNSS